MAAHRAEPARTARGSTELPPGAGRFQRRSALGLLALVLGAVPFLALLLLVQQRWALLRDLDQGVADGLNRLVAPRPAAVDALEALTELGGVLGAAYVLSLTAAFLWVRGRRRLTAYVVTTGLGLLVLVPLTKVLVGRERPRVPVPVTDLPVTDSFPSGHAMTALVTWVVVALVISPSVRNRLRPWLLAMALLLAAAIGFTRLALGVHYLSDVLAGWALGAGWLAVTTALFRAWQAEEGRVSPRVGQGLEEHGTWLAPVQDRLLPDGGRTLARLAGTAAILVAVAAGLSALAPATAGPALPAGAVLAGLSAPWTVLATTVAVSVLVLAVSRRRRPALLPPIAVLGAVGIVLLSAGTAPARQDPSWHAAAAAAAFGALAVLLVVRGGPTGAGRCWSRPRFCRAQRRVAWRRRLACVLTGVWSARRGWPPAPLAAAARTGVAPYPRRCELQPACRRPPIGSRLRPSAERTSRAPHVHPVPAHPA
jgi:undecaprenyl-diphosphatase